MHKLQKSRSLWLVIAVAVTLIWIDPTGFGHMPVGGDATRFGLGLMSELSRAAGQLRVPLWNSLWGYGFPALAESQLGAIYPAHLILYATLPLEWAFATDRSLHAVWAVCGCWVVCRSLGRSAASAGLAAVIFVCSGFFLVHDTHHWAWPTTSWMPWIWWAMLRCLRKDSLTAGPQLNRACFLGLCAAMPVLTGHFQMGFVAMVSGFVLTATLAGLSQPISSNQISIAQRLRPLAAVTFGLGLAATLSAVQILPTSELARLADQQRDWEYLSGFAAPPVHWLGLLLPGLGRRFPFWRPLLWDQFHTSPEELFFYVGLIPLWLAFFGLTRTWRLEPATRALAATLAISLILAAGPYGPGFSLAIRLPGFSYFRAPARWSAAASLCLALLAARGLDELTATNAPPAKSVRRFFAFALAISALSIASLEALVQRAEGPGPANDPVIAVVDGIRGLTIPPWRDVGSWRDWVRRGMAVPPSPIPAYAKPYTNLDRQKFSTDRLTAYAQEAGPHLGLMLAGLILSCGVGSSKTRMIALVCLIFIVDALIVRAYRSAELVPVRDVRSQSPVLARLEQLSSERQWPLAVAGDLGNLPMAANGSPFRAYRTLDVPVMHQLEAAAVNPLEAARSAALRLTGLGYAVIDPPTWRILKKTVRADVVIEEVDDPALWTWLTTSHIAARGSSTFAILRMPGPRGRAWGIEEAALASMGVDQPHQATRTDRLQRLGELARPLETARPRPEHVRIEERTEGAQLWIVSQWADPNWQARLANGSGEEKVAEIIAMDGGWQGVRIPGPGEWKLTLRYEPKSFRAGAAISAVALAITMTMLSWKPVRSRKAIRTDPGDDDGPGAGRA